MLRSGSSGNSAIVTAGATRVLIDAGIGPRVLAKELAAFGLAVKDLAGAIFTHCHSDHVRGNTLQLLAREGVPIHFNEGTWRTAVRREAGSALDRFPDRLVKIFEPGEPFIVGGLEIDACRIAHGDPGVLNPAGDPVCFTLHDGTDTIGYATDLGHLTEAVEAHLRRADLLVLESNHDLEMEKLSPRPYQVRKWIMGDHGHLSNPQAAAALQSLFAGRERGGVVLAHLSEMCNTVGLARNTALEAMAGRCEIAVGVADRLHASVPWTLEKGLARPLGEEHQVVVPHSRDALAEMAAGRMPLPLPAGWPAW